MKGKLPPALVMVIFATLMYILNRFLPVGKFDFFGRQTMVYVVLGLGFLVIVISVIQFLVVKTTVDPMNPENSSQLVTNGIYNYTRNPMYLGMLLFLIAFGLWLSNAFNTLLAAGFVYYMNHFQIKYEEASLTEKFGKEYLLYLKAVRRWF